MRTGRRICGAAALAVTMVAVIQGVPVAVGQLDQWSVQALSQAIQRIRLDVVPNGCGYRQYGDCYWASGRCLNDWWYSVAPCNGVVHQEKPPTGEDPPCPDA